MRKKTYNRRKKGFTLIEVIVVLVVLAILAAILIPSMSKWIDSARRKSLIVACRACVTAAQTLASEEYDGSGRAPYPPTAQAIMELADIQKGSVSSVSMRPTDATINTLSYTDDQGMTVTYLRTPKTRYVFNGDSIEWELGQTYAVGDLMTTNGYYFQCLRAHTTGTTSRTRNPSLRSNKSTWEVIGFTTLTPGNYSSTVRYGVGTVVIYKGKMYTRTDFNLVGGQVPYEGVDSDYWLYVG